MVFLEIFGYIQTDIQKVSFYNIDKDNKAPLKGTLMTASFIALNKIVKQGCILFPHIFFIFIYRTDRPSQVKMSYVKNTGFQEKQKTDLFENYLSLKYGV